MTKVKICGIKTEEHALAAAENGADFIGLVFSNSPRQVTPEQANKIVAALKISGATVKTVGVFANTPVNIVNQIAELCMLDRVQLSGNENFEYFSELIPPFIKAVRIRLNSDSSHICQEMSAWKNSFSGRDYHFLLDSYHEEKFGGTGNLLDWNITSQIALDFELIIAGGLSPENVAPAIKKIRPWCVDVSSGVETGGEKDMKKIKAFVKAARDADAALA
jgi:phosphoribosylanthranilate isomerase